MLTPAPHVHHASGPHGTALLDIQHGTWLMLDADASRIWCAVTVRGSTIGLAEEIAVPAGQDVQQVNSQIAAFVCELTALGVLVDTDRPRRGPRRWGHR